MENDTNIINVKMQFSVPKELKKKVKVMAAYDNVSMQDKVLMYVKKGVEIDKKEKKIF